jgi:NADP-dependent 3-hydroxy acid dehydrogenase YdfG
MKLHNSVVLLTGASQGIGRALALQLDQQGCRLLLVGRKLQALESVAHECKGEPILILADL